MEVTLTAYLALAAWIPLSICLFNLMRPAAAVTVTFVGGYLLLPETVAFDFPAIPPLDKHLISSLGALAGTLIFAGARLRRAQPGWGLEVLAGLVVVSALVTAATNSDEIFIGPITLPGLTPYDGVSMGVRQVLFLGLPFLLGRSLFRSSRDLNDLLTVLAAASVAYSVLIVWEARMSPQLHVNLYGFHPHSFVQNYRFGGWRPQVFTRHGLVLAMFVSFSLICSLGLWRARRPVFGLAASLVSGYLTAILVLCRSVSPTIYAIVVAPLLLLRPSLQLRIATLLVLVPLAYPALRASPLFPDRQMVEFAGSFDAQRAQSLDFRFKNEDKQLMRARERLAFGWGGFGRDRLYDPMDGRDLSVLDGTWIIILGEQGVVGLFVAFGLLLVPVYRARKSLRYFGTRRERVMVATLGWLIAAQAVDMLPNSSFAPLSLLLAGALSGVCDGARTLARVRARQAGALAHDENAGPPALEP
jgi:hypothetical protein